jgi:hypothetical protein
MEKYQPIKLLLPLVIGLTFLAGCENLPGTRAEQGAVIGGASGAVAGSALGDSTFDTLLGGAAGAGAGYIIGKETDK